MTPPRSRVRVTAATAEGTEAYARRRATQGISPRHFRKAQELTLASLGLGTYLGAHDDPTDALSEAAIVRAVEEGTNVIDSAINYRCQRSERAVGRALRTLAERGVGREQVVVCTKGGFVPFDGAPPPDVGSYVDRTFFKTGILRPSELVAGCHSLAPLYLEHQLAASLANLGLSTIDVYYVHNPETQLSEVSRDELLRRLRSAFERLERAVADGKVRFYGMATWDGFRKQPGNPQLLSLPEVVGLAKEVAGADHHFHFIQLPYNLAMPEAFTLRNQKVGDGVVSPLEAASELGLTAMASISIQQGRLASQLPHWLGVVFKGFSTNAQRALQFVRSTPWVTTALVGMKQQAHVDENLAVARIPPAPLEDFLQLFESQG